VKLDQDPYGTPMGIFEKLRAELIDIIEWVDDSRTTLVWRFPRYQNEIKQGAQLIVRPGQVAVFVRQGQVADVFEPGRYELRTDNLPILSTLAGWKHGFNSPFRSEVYFVSTRQVTELKWGTPNPIMLRDPDFGPIRLRAFGTYAMRASDPRTLIKELVGTDGVVDAEEISELMRSLIVAAFAELIGKSQVAALDLASNYRTFSEQLRELVKSRVDDEYGLDVPALFIVNISLPEEVEKALDTRTSMGVIGDMNRFQQYQMGHAITQAASNPGAAGGAMSEGVGLGVGLAMAGRLGQAASGALMPPPPPSDMWHVAVNGQTSGPYATADLQAMIARGQVSAQAHAWSPSLGSWTPIANIPALRGATPPPPPPPASR